MRRSHTLSALSEVVALSGRFEVVSFDLFDTLLTRRTLSFEEIRQLSSARLMRHLDRRLFGTPETVSDRRHHAANVLRDSVALATREPPLQAIVERLLAAGGGMDEDKRRRLAEDAVAFELALEREALVAHADAGTVLAALRRAGKRVVALSDMYFSPTDMNTLLEANGLRHFFDEVFISTGIGETKHEGRVFDVVRRRLGVSPDRILHVGDNAVSDVGNAVAAGWSAARIGNHFPPVPQPEPLDGEALLVDLASDIMAAFLMAVMMRARMNAARRVFFLSRDATVMRRLWERVRQANPHLAAEFHGIEVKELCVSRSATHILSMPWSRDFLRETVGRVGWLAGRKVSCSDVADHYGVPLPSALKHADRCLPTSDLAETMERAGLTEALRTAILERQDMARGYLLQEGAIGDGPVVFGDIGYSGTIAVYISDHLLRERPDLLARTRIDMMMVASNSFLARNRALAWPAASIEPGVVFRHNGLPAILSDNFAWLECLFRDATRGRLRGYRRDGERIEPVFDAATGIADDLRARFEAEAARKLSTGLSALGYGAPARIDRIAAAAMAHFARPSMPLVDAASRLVQEAGGLGLSSHPLVEKVPGAAVPARLRRWKVEDYWISGCLVASEQPRLIDGYGLLKSGNSLLRNAAGLPRRIARRMLR